MKFFWKNKFIFWNLIALIFIKAVFSYSGSQFASLLEGIPTFAKEEIVAETNALRSGFGLSQLKENAVLDTAATQKLKDMLSNQYFAHTRQTGISPWHWIDINNYKYTYAGENLAIGFQSAKDTIDAWSKSPSHRENLLNSKYKEIGVAVAPAEIQGNSGFLVVQVFGTPNPIKLTTKTAKILPIPVGIVTATPVKTPPALNNQPKPTVQSAGKTVVAEKPIAVNVSTSEPKLDKVSKTLNLGFTIYALAIFLASILLIIFRGLKKELLIRTATSLALVVFALVIPVLHLSRTALIL